MNVLATQGAGLRKGLTHCIPLINGALTSSLLSSSRTMKRTFYSLPYAEPMRVLNRIFILAAILSAFGSQNARSQATSISPASSKSPSSKQGAQSVSASTSKSASESSSTSSGTNAASSTDAKTHQTLNGVGNICTNKTLLSAHPQRRAMLMIPRCKGSASIDAISSEYGSETPQKENVVTTTVLSTNTNSAEAPSTTKPRRIVIKRRVHKVDEAEMKELKTAIEKMEARLQQKQEAIENGVDAPDAVDVEAMPDAKLKESFKVTIDEDNAASDAKAKEGTDLVVIEQLESDSDNDQEFHFNVSGAEGGKCRLKFHCDSTPNGTTFQVHVEGMKNALQGMRESMKGMDMKMQKLNKMLRRLNIQVAGLDSSLQLNIEGSHSEDGGSADLKLFVPRGLESLEDLDVDNLNLQTQVEDLDEQTNQVQTHVYILKLRKGDVERNTTFRTEQAENQDLKLEELSLRPNPSNDGHFRLSIQGAKAAPIELRVHTADGREIYTESVKDFNGAFEKNFDLSEYGSGVYFVRVVQDSKAATLKVVIEK